MQFFFKKIIQINKIIDNDFDSDNDYWIHTGHNLIHEILNSFNKKDWSTLNDELANFEEHQLSIFADSILQYPLESQNVNIDKHELFFLMFVMMNDQDNLEYFLFHVMYVEHIKHPKLELLDGINQKIDFIMGNTNDQEIKEL